MEPKDKRMEDVNKLVVNINRNADEEFKESIRHYSASVLSSLLGQNSHENVNYWKNKIMNKVEQNYDTRSVLQCQEAINRVISSNTVKRKSQILKMIFKLSDHLANASENFDVLFNSTVSYDKVSKLNHTQASFNASNVQPTQQTQQKPTFATEQLKIVRYRGSLEQGISEGAILKEITFRLQNIKSQMIITDAQGFSALKPIIDVSDTVRRMVRELSQIGWLYSKITENIEERGAVAKAMRLAVRQEMSEYYRWLAVIENMIKQDELTLRKLVLWSYEPFEKLKWMAIILEAAKPFHGGQIISVINSYRPQGSNSINQLLNRLLIHLMQPLFQYIYNWVYRGQLTDSQGEFFISIDKKYKNVSRNAHQPQWNEWRGKFYLEQKNIPNLLDYQSALQIFNAGKTIYFLKNHCKNDYHLEVPYLDVKTALSDKLHESTSILSPEFKLWLNEVSKISNEELVKTMFEQFKLKDHLNAMKMFYLTGKGDFIQTLMDSLKEELSKPKHQILQYNLEGYIVEALKESFPKNSMRQKEGFQSSKSINFKKDIREEVTERLLAKKVENGPDGWDIFNFEYAVDDPISTVLSPSIIQSYQKIFHFLWKVKRIEQNLKDLWISSAKDYPHGIKLTVLHECHLLRQAMTHFVNNLYGYLMISIESAWNNFNGNESCSIQRAKSFDDILERHEKLVENLLEISLNTPKSKHASTCLSAIFAVILKFSATQQRLAYAYSEYRQKNREYINRRDLIKKGLEFNEELEPPIFNSAGIQSEVRETFELYNRAFDRFYELIKKDPDGRAGALCFRLDFSGYYSQIEYKL